MGQAAAKAVTAPTPEQRRCAYEIDCFRGVYGRAPSLRELGRILGCTHVSVIKRLHYMAKKGLVSGSGRSLVAHCPVADQPGNR